MTKTCQFCLNSKKHW